MNRIDQIIKWESGELQGEDEVRFFADLIKDGTCWSLQGVYGRTASSFIENGIIDKNGKILNDAN